MGQLEARTKTAKLPRGRAAREKKNTLVLSKYSWQFGASPRTAEKHLCPAGVHSRKEITKPFFSFSLLLVRRTWASFLLWLRSVESGGCTRSKPQCLGDSRLVGSFTLKWWLMSGFELQCWTERQMSSVTPPCNAKPFIVSSSLSLSSRRLEMKRTEAVSKHSFFLSRLFILVSFLTDDEVSDTKCRVIDSSRVMFSKILDYK